jgi:hypothetical protein
LHNCVHDTKAVVAAVMAKHVLEHLEKEGRPRSPEPSIQACGEDFVSTWRHCYEILEGELGWGPKE